MNNSKLIVDSFSLNQGVEVDITPILQERQGKLLKIIDALQGIVSTKEWRTLKEEVFDSLTNTLNADIQREARKESPDALKLNRLAGQLKWAEKFSDLSKLEDIFKLELTNIKNKLHGKTKE